jgi:hypothetical protein
MRPGGGGPQALPGFGAGCLSCWASSLVGSFVGSRSYSFHLHASSISTPSCPSYGDSSMSTNLCNTHSCHQALGFTRTVPHHPKLLIRHCRSNERPSWDTTQGLGGGAQTTVRLHAACAPPRPGCSYRRGMQAHDSPQTNHLVS